MHSTIYSCDKFFQGRLNIRQSVSGYRFSLDAVLAAAYVKPESGQKVLDLGTGCGVIPLIVACKNPSVKIWGVEIIEEYARIAEYNVMQNNMADRVKIINLDMKDLSNKDIDGQMDWVVSNPPYGKANSGRINPDSAKAIARHEIAVTLKDVIGAAKRTLKPLGKFLIIYPAQRGTDLFFDMRKIGIEPKKVTAVHPYKDSKATLILVMGVKGGRPGLCFDPPIFLYKEKGVYSKEVLQFFEP